MVTNRNVRIVGLVLLVVVGGIGWWAWAAPRSRTPEQRQEAARALLDGVRASGTVASSTLVATSAFADFGGKGGIHLVRVRIVDELQFELRVQVEREVVLAEPPKACLVGPYSAPDDAGLSDPCWGDPDLGVLLTAELPIDGAGHPVLRAGSSIAVHAPLRRGQVRCDYPPGTWHLEMAANALIDGSAVGAVYLPDVAVEVPWQGSTALPLLPLNRTRYCGLADAVFLEQGEPAVSSP